MVTLTQSLKRATSVGCYQGVFVKAAVARGAGLWGLNSPPFLPPFEMSSVIKEGVFFVYYWQAEEDRNAGYSPQRRKIALIRRTQSVVRAGRVGKPDFLFSRLTLPENVPGCAAAC